MHQWLNDSSSDIESCFWKLQWMTQLKICNRLDIRLEAQNLTLVWYSLIYLSSHIHLAILIKSTREFSVNECLWRFQGGFFRSFFRLFLIFGSPRAHWRVSWGLKLYQCCLASQRLWSRVGMHFTAGFQLIHRIHWSFWKHSFFSCKFFLMFPRVFSLERYPWWPSTSIMNSSIELLVLHC